MGVLTLSIIRDFITSRRKMDLLKRENLRLKVENKKLRSQLKKKPTIADRTNKKERITAQQIITEYLFGAEGVSR